MFPILFSSKAAGEVFEESTSVGDLWMWGDNNGNGPGVLGQGNTTDYSSPVQVGLLYDWETVHGSTNCCYFLKSDGTLWSIGDGTLGGLGTGSETDISSPAQIGGETTWRKINGGQQSGKAIKSDGTLWHWGYSSYGQGGVGNANQYSSPVQVGGLTTWGQFANTGANFNGCLTTSGELFTWGFNTQGGLGHGNTTAICSPVAVAGGAVWSYVAMGLGHCVAVRKDGTLWAWGYNGQGAVGRDATGNTCSPAQVGALTDWKFVHAGSRGSHAIKTDGTLWGWGWNAYGQIGNGDATDYSSPVKIGLDKDWTFISGDGFATVFAVKSNGALYSWGANGQGQLGLGDTTHRCVPTQVGAFLTWRGGGNQSITSLYAEGHRIGGGNTKFAGHIKTNV